MKNNTQSAMMLMKERKEQQKEQEHNIKLVTGKIISIDDDHFPLRCTHGIGTFFFEVITIRSNSGEEIILVNPGSVNFKEEQQVSVKYMKKTKITYHDLFQAGKSQETDAEQPAQEGIVYADGLIIN